MSKRAAESSPSSRSESPTASPSTSTDELEQSKRKTSKKSIVNIIEHKTNVQAQLRQAELDIRKRELEIEEKKLALQEKKDEALISLLAKLADKK